jgi:G3E family GTPase
MTNNDRIPVSIITGFLGAGKTNLLNRLITKCSEKKFAIIENEFGETGIDGGLIATAAENIFELNNGCICCSLGDDFLNTLENLLGSSLHFDHLLVETTGIADPSGIVDAFVSGETIQQRFMIDSVICVVDAENAEDLFNTQSEVKLQLALADVILMNKTDLVHSTYPEHLTRLIRTVNPTAKIYQTTYCSVDNISILGQNSFSGKSIEKSTLSFCGIDRMGVKHSGQKSFIHRPENHQDELKHDITSVGFTFDGSFDVNKFGLWIQNYLYFNSGNIFRVKGIMSFSDTDDQFVFHAVRSSFMFEVGKPWGDTPRFSKLVFIGKSIPAKELESNLLQLMVP